MAPGVTQYRLENSSYFEIWALGCECLHAHCCQSNQPQGMTSFSVFKVTTSVESIDQYRVEKALVILQVSSKKENLMDLDIRIAFGSSQFKKKYNT